MMDVNFNSVDYWLHRGKGYIHEAHIESQFHRDQEKFLIRQLRSFTPKTILELGCGFGRVTAVMADEFPNADIMAFDVSPDQIDRAVHDYRRSKVHFVCADVTKIQHFLRFDVAVAIELFLHLHHHDLLKLVPTILKSCRVLIHDFDVNPIDYKSRHITMHNYGEIYQSLGLMAETIIQEPFGLMVVRG